MANLDAPDGGGSGGSGDGSSGGSGDGGGVIGGIIDGLSGVVSVAVDAVTGTVDSAKQLAAFRRNPVAFIIAAVAGWLVEGVLGVARAVIAAIAAAGEPIVAIPGIVGDAVGDAWSPVQGAVLGLLNAYEATVSAVAASTGPFAPLALTALGALTLLGALGLLRWLDTVVTGGRITGGIPYL